MIVVVFLVVLLGVVLVLCTGIFGLGFIVAIGAALWAFWWLAVLLAPIMIGLLCLLGCGIWWLIDRESCERSWREVAVMRAEAKR